MTNEEREYWEYWEKEKAKEAKRDSLPIENWSDVTRYWEKQRMGSLPISTGTQRPSPSAILIRGAKDAERVARNWMVYMGFKDAILTKDGPDGGVDVRAAGAVAQVKAEMKPTGRPPIQALYGIAAVERRAALFFSLAGYTIEAKNWAQHAPVALFTFNLAGQIEGANERGSALLANAGR